MKKQLLVRVGKNMAVKEMVVRLVKEAGYCVYSPQRNIELAEAFRFEENDSGYSCNAECYEDSGYEGVNVDIGTELNKFLELLKEERLTLCSDGTTHEILCNKDGSLTIGCTTVSSDLFEKIVAERTKVLSK